MEMMKEVAGSNFFMEFNLMFLVNLCRALELARRRGESLSDESLSTQSRAEWPFGKQVSSPLGRRRHSRFGVSNSHSPFGSRGD